MSEIYKLEPFDINELKNLETRKSSYRCVKRDVRAVVQEFAEGDFDCCKICESENNSQAHVECTIIRRTVRIFKYDNVKVVLRGNCVYLVKKNKWE